MILNADARSIPLQDRSVQCCVTSPPYFGLRDYGNDAQIGLEDTPAAFVANLVAVFREVYRVLKDDGVLWMNLGDSYVASARGNKPGDTSKSTLNKEAQGYHDEQVARVDKTRFGLAGKNLIGIPWRVALALQDDGWILRSDIIWHKTSCMPESVKDRPTRNHEYLFMFAKRPKYYYDADAIAEPIAEASRKRYTAVVENNETFDPDTHKHGDGVQAPMEVMTRAAAGIIERGIRNKRTVWSISPQNYSGAHFATYPEKLPATCILASSRIGDVVLDPFSGSGTTGVAAEHFGRKYVGVELNPAYATLSVDRIRQGSKKLPDLSLF